MDRRSFLKGLFGAAAVVPLVSTGASTIEDGATVVEHGVTDTGPYKPSGIRYRWPDGKVGPWDAALWKKHKRAEVMLNGWVAGYML